MATLERYEYTLLTDPKSQIRLLEIEKEPSSEKIKGKLSTWNLKDAPPYHAISYTWGPEQPIEQIILNNKTTMIRKNCADALRQILHFNPSRYYWMDALSIAQSNNEEKSHQVAKMAQIYGHSAHVLACLGNYDDDADYALHLLRQFKDRKDSVDYFDLLRSERFVHALGALAKRPYFERVWVVQEFVLGREVTMYSGIQQLAVKNDHTGLVSAQIFAFGAEGKIANVNQALRTQKMLQFFRLRRNFWESDDATWKASLDTLSPIYAGLKCHDPRDFVYGMLGLTDWGSTACLEPNYDKSKYDLAAECLVKLDSDNPSGLALLLSKMGMKVMKKEVDVEEGDFGWLRRRMEIDRGSSYKLFFVPPATKRPMIGIPMYGMQLSQICRATDRSRTHDTGTGSVREVECIDALWESGTKLLIPSEARDSDWMLHSDHYDNGIIARREILAGTEQRLSIVGTARVNKRTRASQSRGNLHPVHKWEFVTWFRPLAYGVFREGESLRIRQSTRRWSSYVVNVSSSAMS